MKIITDESLLLYIRHKYVSHGADIKDFNIFGVRDYDSIEDSKFNDTIGFFTKDKIVLMWGTTDPSAYYIKKNPMNKEGTAIMCLGWQPDIWVVDKHGRSRYTALCNRRWKGCKKQRVRRLDTKFEYNNKGVFEGYFSCNLHRANLYHILSSIGKWSAGCQVIQDAVDFEYFLSEAISSGVKKFGYFLFDKTEIHGGFQL